jgi:hypothetical protein
VVRLELLPHAEQEQLPLMLLLPLTLIGLQAVGLISSTGFAVVQLALFVRQQAESVQAVVAVAVVARI